MSTTTPTTISPATFGTGTLPTPAFPGGPGFIMSATEWQSLQTFFSFVATLPKTTSALQTQMGSGAPSDMSDFNNLITLYNSLQTQGTNYTTNIFPSIVALAGSVANYGNSISAYYGGLSTEIAVLQNPNSTPSQITAAQQNIIGIVQQLASTTQGYITQAQSVNTSLQTMVSALNSDINQINGTGGLYSYYNTTYGTTSTAVQNIITTLASDKASLKQYQEQYHHDVVVAATTPTYAWINIFGIPVGLIAAAIVAGIYGSAATNALNNINSLQGQISTLDAQEVADTNLMIALNTVMTECQSLSTRLTNVVNILEGMQGGWSAITSDLNNINSILNNDFKTGIAFLENINYSELISDWTNLATLATTYQTTAFISAPAASSSSSPSSTSNN